MGQGRRQLGVGGDEEAVADEGPGASHEGGEGSVGYERAKFEIESGGLSFD